jgi:hypothetical protein
MRPRLTRGERAILRTQLSQWLTPDEMLQVANDTGDRIGSTNLFNQGGLELLRDALTAAEFGKARRVNKVRLIPEPENWPDFELRVGGAVERFEAAEVDDPARRRGDEYRFGNLACDPVADWIARAEQTPAWIASVCQKKVDKRYDGRARLVLYLNVSDHGVRQAEIVASFQSATSVAKDHFDAIWILWNYHAYHVWQGAEYVGLSTKPIPSAELAAQRFRYRHGVVLGRRREHLRKRGCSV